MAANSVQVAYEAAGITCRRAGAVTAAAALYKTWLDAQGNLDDARAALMAAARTSNRPAQVLLRAAQCFTEVSGDATLVSIAVTPTATIAPAGTQQMVATGTYSDSLTHVVTTHAAWTSATGAHATVGAATGLVTGVADGTSVITATIGGISGTATITVAG